MTWGLSNAIGFTTAEAHWTVNGEESLWEPKEIKAGDELGCSWQLKSGSTLSDETKAEAEYGIFHIGPVCYPKDDAAAPAYVLVASAQQPGADDYEHQCERPRFLPLTDASVRSEIDDVSKPVAWRAQILVLAWDQPRPSPNADAILTDVFQNGTKYPLVLRKGAAWGLVRREYAPARPMLFSLLRNRAAPAEWRCTILSGLEDVLTSDDVDWLTVIAKDKTEAASVRAAVVRRMGKFKQTATLTAIARDKTDDEEVRYHALSTLAKNQRYDVLSEIARDGNNPERLRNLALEKLSLQGGEAGWQVIDQLKDDPTVGEKARQLLKDRNTSEE